VVRAEDVELIFSTQSFGQNTRLMVGNLIGGLKGETRKLFVSATIEDIADVAEVLRQATEATYREATQNLQGIIDRNEFNLSIPNPFSKEEMNLVTEMDAIDRLLDALGIEPEPQ
jgi:transcription initiation factor TFIIIB Brf1 subunit/transcription initiation factor TFIIB